MISTRLREILDREAPHEALSGVAELSQCFAACTPEVRSLTVPKEGAPYGRYLLCRGQTYNVQLDVFSAAYTGLIHCHDTWGMFWVLKGSLITTDYYRAHGVHQCVRRNALSRGSGQCFSSRASDWHQTETPDSGPQTVSLHVYGPGFDMERGTYLDAQMISRTSARGPWGDLSRLTFVHQTP